MILDAQLTKMQKALYDGTMQEPLSTVAGDGNTPVLATDTTLDNEVLRAATVNGEVGTDTNSYTTEFSTAQGNGTLFCESGVVDTVAGAGGVLACRKVFPSFEKTVNYSLRITTYIKNENK